MAGGVCVVEGLGKVWQVFFGDGWTLVAYDELPMVGRQFATDDRR